MTNFDTFCAQLATEHHIDITDSVDVPEQYIEPVNVLVNIMKPKMNRLKKISIPFIESQFDDIDNACKVLDNKTNNMDVPDGIINALSNALYCVKFNDLKNEEQAIIKVLSCYLLLQN